VVIQEAFFHGRPVITSDIGGMAEKVRDRVDGLHFRAGSAESLADSLISALRDQGLWELASGGL
jgi:glycosyltransferase involved in cell wall biosynthesis